jgi:putative tryptophan/tyrosine transport system substrate-binding protein
MRRRDFVMLLGGIAVGVCENVTAALAQSAQPPRIGWLKIQSRTDTPGWLREFRAGLRELGHVEGRTFILEERYADGNASRLTQLAEELVQTRVSVIVATSQPATDAARRVTHSVPIVGRMTDDPVRTGLARSLAQPGANVTGIYSLLEETSAKRLELLQQAVPSMRRVGALLTLDRGATRRWLAETECAARQLGLILHTMNVNAPEDLPRVFGEAAAQHVEGLIAIRNPTVVTYAREVIELANRYRMPSIFEARDYVETGAFMSYGPSLEAIFRSAAGYVDKILKGDKPGDLPIEQSAKLELVVNLKTAKSLDIALPPSILASADEVIE